MAVDLNDFVHKETTRHGKPVKLKLYRHSCSNCGSDRGYQAKSFEPPTCNKCSHKGIILSKETKKKMSEAAIKRANDPNWKPKEKTKKFLGCRRPKSSYIRKVSLLHRKLKHRTKSLLWQKLKNRQAHKMGSTFDILGYTVEDLVKHLESKFQKGMSWDNYGKNGWEIDHIIPDSYFHYSSIEDIGFKDSWALDNLQPLWYWDNRSKGAKHAGSCLA